ncbi:hypothetical protein GCM10017562_73590 [Streptomyces roseofulvus]|uniref:Alpha-ketoglutarate-dependent dioxygenase AlkB-like domain-containing protein n=2 Tax=Streptomyces TaxID=1883 RepID=A0ABU4KFV6_9ACTN|nr:alpha-ketoglutarate-dependent dioxygenase AlkB [Streptomyces roseolus]MDX2296675.1 hypothetical protein [Streptomyces roseolus]
MPPASEVPDEIIACTLPADGEGDPFTELMASAHLEDLGKGRTGAVLSRIDASGGVPLVRTTTRYAGPAQRFQPLHERLAARVQERAAIPVSFNNALMECYTNAYKRMGGHSDQALDLAEDSFIAVYSCYRHPEASPQRKLIFEPKGSADERYEISLTHHSVVAFSVEANRRFRHRIVWDPPAAAREPDNPWLGVTFRTSKTTVRFVDGHVSLPQGVRLTLADDEQARAFYRLRRRENDETDFTYPPLSYTVSESDLMPPA